MRVLLVANGYPPEARGGVETYTHFLAMSLAERGHAVEVFCRVGAMLQPEYTLRLDCPEGVPVRRVVNDLTDAVQFEDHYHNPRFEPLFLRHVRAFRPEVIHFQHCLGLSASLLPAARALNLPSVVTLHDFWFLCPRATLFKAEKTICLGPHADVDCIHCLGGVRLGGVSWLQKWPIYKWLLARLSVRLNQGFRSRLDRSSASLPAAPTPSARRALARHQAQMQARTARLFEWLKLADWRLTPSAFVKGIYQAHGFPPEAIQVLPLGVEQEALKKAAQTGRQKPAGELIIAYIGSLQFHKGPDLLIRAYRSLPALLGQLVLYGRGAAADVYESEVQQLARDDARVCFRGPFDRSELPAVLSQVDLLVVPSRCYETYSLIAREALLAGVPVLAARAGALADVVVEGVNGYLFPPGDVEALARGLRLAVTNLEQLRAGAQTTPPPPTLAAHVSQLESIYGQILHAHSASQ